MENNMITICSIHPKWVEMIFNGKKKFEFRKYSWSTKEVLIYETSPISMIVGKMTGCFLYGPKNEIWEATQYYAERIPPYKIKNIPQSFRYSNDGY